MERLNILFAKPQIYILIIVTLIFGGMAVDGATVNKDRHKTATEIAISDVLESLARANNIKIEVQDNRKHPCRRPTAKIYKFRRGEFWKEYALIERDFNVFLLWDENDGKGEIHIVDKDLILDNGINLARQNYDLPMVGSLEAGRRYRILFCPGPMYRSFPPPKNLCDTSHVVLQWLPGEVPLKVQWIPSAKSFGDSQKGGSIFLGSAKLGDIPTSRIKDFGGVIYVTLAKQWKDITLDLIPGTKVVIPNNNLISSIEFLRLSGDSGKWIPDDITNDNNKNHQMFVEYYAEFLIHGTFEKDKLLFSLHGNYIIDEKLQNHLGYGIGSLGEIIRGFRPRHFLSVPTWPGSAFPKKMVLHLPIKTSEEVIQIKKMEPGKVNL